VDRALGPRERAHHQHAVAEPGARRRPLLHAAKEVIDLYQGILKEVKADPNRASYTDLALSPLPDPERTTLAREVSGM